MCRAHNLSVGGTKKIMLKRLSEAGVELPNGENSDGVQIRWELREKCKEMGLDSSGNLAVLRQRIADARSSPSRAASLRREASATAKRQRHAQLRKEWEDLQDKIEDLKDTVVENEDEMKRLLAWQLAALRCVLYFLRGNMQERRTA